MENNERHKKRAKGLCFAKSLSVFGIELLSNGLIQYTCALHDDDLMSNEDLDKNADYLAHVIAQNIKTVFGVTIYKKVVECLDSSQHENAQIFKYKFQTKLYEIQQKEEPVVPASKVFGP